MPQRKIIHVDMDAFYASVEQRDNPALRGRPIAVGHDGPRGVVSTASYEARPFGVHSALPSVTARRLCPQLIFVPPRFEIYKAVSQQIRAVFREYTELVLSLIHICGRGEFRSGRSETLPYPSGTDRRQAAVAFSSFFMIEKMNSAESRQSTISTLHTIQSAMPLPQR